MELKLLILDDDPLVTMALECMIPDNWKTYIFHSPKEVDLNESYHAAFVDMHLSGDIDVFDGIEFIKKFRKGQPNVEVSAVSGDLNQKTMEMALEAGASRYIAKPFNEKYLKSILNQIETYYELMKNNLGHTTSSSAWVGSSQKFKELTKSVSQLKHQPGPILIEGETGTGKEIVARLLRSADNKPFVPINIAEISESLFESEFFGHEKGAFTGAQQSKMGLAEIANGGDLFIDEIEALPTPAQVKLLRFLQEGEVRRVGSSEIKTVNVRVIIATNEKLEDKVKSGEFREDLLWRINGKKIEIPPLRERKDDIATLCKHFFSDLQPHKSLTPEAIELLREHDWPGNIRELRRLCEKIVHFTPLPIVRAEDIQNVVHLSSPSDDIKIDSNLSLEKQVQMVEKSIIENALEKQQNIDKVCDKLDISRSNLYKKIKLYEINWKK